MLDQLQGVASVARPLGGWSLLLDVSQWDLSGVEAAERLFNAGIAVTPMAGWGSDDARRYVRLVFSREPVERYTALGARLQQALHG